MDWIEILTKVISGVVTGLILLILKKIFTRKAKLITYFVHASAIPLPQAQPPSQVNTHAIVVRNVGRATAKNVRIGHNFLPSSYQIFPQVAHQVVGGVGGVAEILIPTLVADEEISISYLYFPPLMYTGINSYTKFDDGNAKAVNAMLIPIPSRIAKFTYLSLMFVGASSIVYMAINYFLKTFV